MLSNKMYSSNSCGYSCGGGGYVAASAGYSLEAAVSTAQPQRVMDYSSSSNTYQQSSAQYFISQQKQYQFVDQFLHWYRPKTQFIDKAEQVEDYVRETFKALMKKDLPENIFIEIVDKERIKHLSKSQGTIGISFNGIIKQIFVLENELDKLMLVIGHELGHVLTPTLKNQHNEEAKAFAFELAWAKTIVDNNVANLQHNINPDFEPAKNGLHDIAFDFVRKVIKTGKKAINVYFDIIADKLQISLH